MIRPRKLHIDINIIMFIVYKLRIYRIKVTIIITLFYLFKDFTVYIVLLPINASLYSQQSSQPYYCFHFVAEKTEAQSVYDYSIII